MKDVFTSPVFVPGKRKYILIAKDNNDPLLLKIIDALKRTNSPFEQWVYCDEKPLELVDVIKLQKVGTYFYIALNQQAISILRPSLRGIGLTSGEVQYITTVAKEKTVFCSRCHEIFSVQEIGRGEVSCPACQLRLEVSEHFSTIKNAYMGYVAASELKE
ncbi:hypothetical protein FIU87_20530 [Bacillus sp. THAF10]|uniref:dimethylamine monooxygenase subunit DmmA family protein n=1 Tax=Bacillus sp. THAF10 TaxID=2587848 RepID=UPI001269236A|nr:dimethylamine monooxygenase subunit DmmA family protein [Bacillus sp. THAF10]QFT91040.1 hypothetical protein FIU87_20530 [Bacillus sp. THAF10]